MPSTYSPSLKIELIGNGEQTGTWGQTTNNNMGTLIEQAITGVGQITLTGDYTLTSLNGLPDDSRNAVLVFSGSLANAANVTAPSVEKTYIITNNAGNTVTIKTSGGNGLAIQNGLNALVYCDGTDFYSAVQSNQIVGDLAVTGNVAVSGNIISGGNLSIYGTVVSTTGNLTLTSNTNIVDMSTNTGAFIPPTGTTAQRPASPIVGMSRWNSTSGVYEIWNGVAWQVVASGSYSIDYLLVAGGGGSSYGGGGGGGFLTTIGGSQLSVNPGTTYTVVVGAAGTAGSAGSAGGQGGNSSFTGVTVALGGGGGGAASAGVAGGSGGGGGSAVASGGSGTSGQGNAGGTSITGGSPFYTASGGGGAGAVGSPNTVSSSGAGGNGLASVITGSSVYYAGGGGAGYGGGSSAANGLGGGSSSYGGGGQGAFSAGGPGVVILSILTTNYSGTTTGSPSVSTNGAYTVLTYTTSGSYTA